MRITHRSFIFWLALPGAVLTHSTISSAVAPERAGPPPLAVTLPFSNRRPLPASVRAQLRAGADLSQYASRWNVWDIGPKVGAKAGSKPSAARTAAFIVFYERRGKAGSVTSPGARTSPVLDFFLRRPPTSSRTSSRWQRVNSIEMRGLSINASVSARWLDPGRKSVPLLELEEMDLFGGTRLLLSFPHGIARPAVAQKFSFGSGINGQGRTFDFLEPDSRGFCVFRVTDFVRIDEGSLSPEQIEEARGQAQHTLFDWDGRKFVKRLPAQEASQAPK